MSAVKYTPDPEVMGAIERWRGNVTAAADQLGVQPKNLRKRLAKLGVDLAALRAGGAPGAGPLDPMAPIGPSGPSRPPVAKVAPRMGAGRKSESGPHAAPSLVAGGSRTLAGMQQAAVKDAPDVASARTPVPAAPPRQRPIRNHPDDVARVRAARLDLIAKYRVEFDESTIQHEFYLAKFDEFMAEKLGAEKRSEKKR